MSNTFCKFGDSILLPAMPRRTQSKNEFCGNIDWKQYIVGNKLVLSIVPYASVILALTRVPALDKKLYNTIYSTVVVDVDGKVYFMEKRSQETMELVEFVDISTTRQLMVSSHVAMAETYNWLSSLGHEHFEICNALEQVWICELKQLQSISINEIAEHLATITGKGPEFEPITKYSINVGKKVVCLN